MNKGFTLLEMIVAIGIFTIVVTIALASLLNISQIQQRAEAFRTVNDNLNYAIELMSRELKTGKTYNDSAGCLNFVNDKKTNVTYCLSDGQITRKEEKVGVPDIIHILTAPEINVDTLNFVLRKNTPSPLIIIVAKGTVTIGKTVEKFNLQTTVSQRPALL